jgi:small-conductance mechanosensitive channel
VFAPVRPYLLHHWLRVRYTAYAGVIQVVVSALLAGLAVLAVLELFDVSGAAVYPVVVVGGGGLYGVLVMLLARPVIKELTAALSLVMARRRRGRGNAAPATAG